MQARRAPGPAAAPEGDQPAGGARQLRADAARNHERILAAAEEVFARDGLAVPVDAVAKEAGVGIGTLYRHFPTKEALFEAIVLAKVDDLIGSLELQTETTPGAAFFGFLERIADETASKQDLFDALSSSGVEFTAHCTDRMEELKKRLDQLRCSAADGGEIRSDVTTEQILELVVAACRGTGPVRKLPAPNRQMLQVVFDGLRQVGSAS